MDSYKRLLEQVFRQLAIRDTTAKERPQLPAHGLPGLLGRDTHTSSYSTQHSVAQQALCVASRCGAASAFRFFLT